MKEIIKRNGLLILTDDEFEDALKRGESVRRNRNLTYNHTDFSDYFKIGMSDEYILIREDFPMDSISPSEFSRLCRKMFRKNDETRHGN